MTKLVNIKLKIIYNRQLFDDSINNFYTVTVRGPLRETAVTVFPHNLL